MNFLLLLNFALGAYMTGVLWLVQLVHYPSFECIAEKKFQKFHSFHQKRISWVVVIAMLLE